MNVLHLIGIGWFACTFHVAMLPAGTLRCDGILGNSGADGPTIVRGSKIAEKSQASGEGLAYDRLGALWAFGGQENVIRYALDGRMLGSYDLPGAQNQRHALSLVGDWLVIQSGDKLYRLSISAPSGEPLEPLKPKVQALSLRGDETRVALILADRKVGWLNPESGEVMLSGELPPEARGQAIASLPDGTLFVDGRWTYRDGQPPVKVGPIKSAYYQMAGDYLYTFAWHMTVARRNLDLANDPGVVYGGSSGYFIGNLPADGEITIPRGIAHLGGDRFALAGPYGTIHLLEWNEQAQAFQTTRRLGFVHFPSVLALDNQGRVWYYSGFWEWNDRPDQSLRSPMNFAHRQWDRVQAAVLPNGNVSFPYLRHGKASMADRGFEQSNKKQHKSMDGLPKSPTGAAVLNEREMLLTNADGEGLLVPLNSSGIDKKPPSPARINLNEPAGEITSLAPSPMGLLAAVDGHIVTLKRDGNQFQEITRFNNWGSGQDATFGPEIYLDVADDHLWVSDTTKNRVLYFQLSADDIVSFAVYTDEGLETPIQEPGRISAAGRRAVFVDAGNQRLIKLSQDQKLSQNEQMAAPGDF